MRFKTAFVAGLVFAVLLHLLGYSLPNAPFIYLSLPGLMAAELSPSNALALPLEIGVNALFHAGVLWTVSKLLRGFQSPAR